jgi:hypothetical protein
MAWSSSPIFAQNISDAAVSPGTLGARLLFSKDAAATCFSFSRMDSTRCKPSMRSSSALRVTFSSRSLVAITCCTLLSVDWIWSHIDFNPRAAAS